MTRRWEVDERALRVAESRLNLRFPIEVKVTSQRKTAGRYKGIKRQGRQSVHKVTLSSQICPAEAGKTLWHEAQHAAQRERYASNRAFFQAIEESRQHFEDEAQAIERLNRRIPLCRPR